MTARVAGGLFVTATVASLLSTGLLNPVLSGPDYLLKISAHQDQVVAGAFFQVVAAFAGAGIAVSLYPVLKRHGEALALGSVGFRLLEGALLRALRDQAGLAGVLAFYLGASMYSPRQATPGGWRVRDPPYGTADGL